MMMHAATLAVLFAVVAVCANSYAHCDTTRGPVITAARAALKAGDPNLVLHWVRPDDEQAIRTAFQHTMAVRALGSEAKALADRYFFETLVRIHRAGEGFPYTGITDAEPDPIVAAADRALERGAADELQQLLVDAVRAGLTERFEAARAAKDYPLGDVARGRAFVATYVPLTHWLEEVYVAAKGTGAQHGTASDQTPHMQPAVDAPDVHSARGPWLETHGHTARRIIPWIIAALLAVAALIEGAFLLRRRRHRAT